MASYAEEERQAREEQLDWLSQQTALLQHQGERLDEIARHTRLLYWVMIVWLLLSAIAFLAYLTN